MNDFMWNFDNGFMKSDEIRRLVETWISFALYRKIAILILLNGIVVEKFRWACDINV